MKKQMEKALEGVMKSCSDPDALVEFASLLSVRWFAHGFFVGCVFAAALISAIYLVS